MLPPAVAPRDDGSIWPAVNQWDAGWEKKYSDWVAETIDADFFLRNRIWTDCADVPYLVRWIFARIHYLPQGCHDRFGNGFGSWSRDFSHLPRHADWKKDQRFMRALEQVCWTVQGRSVPFDCYPIGVLPEHGYLRPGTVIGDEKHTRIVTEVNRHSFNPIMTSASTLPPEIRRLTVEMLNRDAEFDVTAGYGIINFNWWRRNPQTGAWETVPDEEMPGYSQEQYDLINEIQEEHLAFFLQKAYAYTITDPLAAYRELIADLRNAIDTRLEVVQQGYDYFQQRPGMRGDTKSDAYDFFSTNQRDSRIKSKYANLRQLVAQKHMTEGQLETLLAAETFTLSNGKEMTFLELDYAVQMKLLSPEPWDSPDRRWGAGEYRLLWSRNTVNQIDKGLAPGPQGGFLAVSDMGFIAAFSKDGEMLWSQYASGGEAPMPVSDDRGTIFQLDNTGMLQALDPASGQPVWTARIRGSSFSSPAVGGAEGLLYAASDRGEVAAFRRQDGAEAWTLDLGAKLTGVAASRDQGPLFAAAADGQVFGVSREGQAIWQTNLGAKLYAPPTADAQGNAYALTLGGDVVSLAPDGKIRWSDSFGGKMLTRPIIGADGNLYVVAGAALACFNPTGGRRWSATVGDSIYSPPAVAPDGRVYVGSMDKNMYALSNGGALRWTFPAAGSVLASPHLGADGTIYVGVLNKRVYALKER